MPSVQGCCMARMCVGPCRLVLPQTGHLLLRLRLQWQLPNGASELPSGDNAKWKDGSQAEVPVEGNRMLCLQEDIVDTR